jgi:hypothetical protein
VLVVMEMDEMLSQDGILVFLKKFPLFWGKVMHILFNSIIWWWCGSYLLSIQLKAANPDEFMISASIIISKSKISAQ